MWYPNCNWLNFLTVICFTITIHVFGSYLYFRYMYKYCVSYFLSCSVWWLNLLLKVKCWPYRKLLFTCIYFIRNYWTNDRYFTVNDVIINSFYKYLIWATIKIMGFECYFQQYFCYISDGQFYWWGKLKHLQDTTDPSLSNLIYKLCKKKKKMGKFYHDVGCIDR